MADQQDTGQTANASDGSTPTMTAVLELDEVFDALAHPRRRYLLYTLLEDGDDSTLTQLATRVAAWEHDLPVADVTDDLRDSVYVSLYHCHVPHLASLDVLTYHEEDEVVVSGANTDQVRAVLDCAGVSTDTGQETHARSDLED